MENYPWVEAYRVALLELDQNKVPERLATARQKLKERMRTAGLAVDEKHAIADALNVLYAVESNENSRRQSGVGYVHQSRSTTR